VYNPAIAAMPAKPFYHYLSCRADLVCTVANFPGLYLMTEVQSVVAQMNPGQSRVSGDRVDALMRQFLQRVKQNLHVVVCLRVSGESQL